MKFRSAVLDLPPNVRAELEAMIDKSKSGLSIYSSLKEKYSTQTTIPSVPTILRYMRYYQEKKGAVQKQVFEEKLAFSFEDGLKEIASVVVQVSQGKEPDFNKVKLLEGLAGKCLQRVHLLEESSKSTKKDPRIETAIARYISEAKGIIESVTKLSEEVSKDEQIMIQLIRNESREVLAAVKDVILSICPEKYDLFKEKLKIKLSEKGAVIDAQPVEEVPQALPEPEQITSIEPKEDINEIIEPQESGIDDISG